MVSYTASSPGAVGSGMAGKSQGRPNPHTELPFAVCAMWLRRSVIPYAGLSSVLRLLDLDLELYRIKGPYLETNLKSMGNTERTGSKFSI